jgi:hypothetical protein
MLEFGGFSDTGLRDRHRLIRERSDVGLLRQRGEVSDGISYENRIASIHPGYLTHG